LVLLRAHRPAVYNRGLALRHEMMQLAIEEKRRQLEAPMTIEGSVGGLSMIDLQPIQVCWLPHNHRIRSPHLPGDFDPDGWDHNTPLPIQAYPQDGSGLRVPLPKSVMVVVHPEEDLPVSMTADGERVSPAVATDLWHRVESFNKGVVLMNEAVSPGWLEQQRQQPLGYAAQPTAAELAEGLPPEEEHQEDDDHPPTIECGTDWSGGFGRE
jgi:hypothetical protein